MQRTESTALEKRNASRPGARMSEGWARFAAWSISTVALLTSLLEGFVGFVGLAASTSGAWTLCMLGLMVVAYVQYYMSRYLAFRRRELTDLFMGEGTLSPGRLILTDFSRYFILNVTLHLAYAMIPAGFIAGMFVSELGPGSGYTLMAALLTPILFWHYSGRLSTYVQGLIERFATWDGMSFGVPPRHAGMLDGMAAWYERRVFPPIRLVNPTYIQILAEEAPVPEQLPPGADVETTDLVRVEALPGDDDDETSMRCQVCGTAVEGAHVRCSRCESPHHADCWEFNDGCSTYGCGGKDYRDVE